jgi:hypothetical protein
MIHSLAHKMLATANTGLAASCCRAPASAAAVARSAARASLSFSTSSVDLQGLGRLGSLKGKPQSRCYLFRALLGICRVWVDVRRPHAVARPAV